MGGSDRRPILALLPVSPDCVDPKGAVVVSRKTPLNTSVFCGWTVTFTAGWDPSCKVLGQFYRTRPPLALGAGR